MMYCCFDNEAYMNTGIQRSSATPFGAMTTTTPPGHVGYGQITWKKNMAEIAAAHGIPYVATACSSYPLDLMEKVKKAKAIQGPSYLNILSVCPTGWRIPSDLAIRYGRLAVETGVYPLYEVERGKYRLSVEFPKHRPVGDYLQGQGRFRHLTPDLIEKIQERVTREYESLKAKTQLGKVH
jgi:pyruvate ferredoxin oxidoreductase beta subunit